MQFKEVSKWNGLTWSFVGDIDTGSCKTMVTDGINIYLGGTFIKVNNITVNRVAKWNGQNWSAIDAGFNNECYTLAVDGPILYAGGSFTQAGSLSTTLVNYISKFDGTKWTKMTDFDNYCNYLLVSQNTLYAGGIFTNNINNETDGIIIVT